MLRSVLFGALVPVVLLGTSHAQTSVRFPSITSYNLAKDKVRLPGGLKGKQNLLVLSFDVSRSAEVDRWITEAQSLQHLHDDLHYYVLPIAGRENDLYRWWENSSMRGNYSDPQEWPWIVPLYVNEKQFRHALQIPDDHDLVILLTDQKGQVLWRTNGPLTAQKRAAIAGVVK